MNRGTDLYNRAVQRERDERLFPLRVKLMIGSGLLIGLLIALALFIGTVRAAEKLVQHFNP